MNPVETEKRQMSEKSLPRSAQDLALKEARQLMERLDDEPSHALQVRRLALDLYDQLTPLHGYGKEERLLLECASLLHDIGWSIKPNAHNKGARDAILAEPFVGLDDRQRLIVALVARYHRKSHPHSRHRGYRDLRMDDRRIVRVLASILRIADGLDRSHTENIRQIDCDYSDGQLRLRFVPRGDPSMELFGLRKKLRLFEEEFGMAVWGEPVREL